MTAVTPDPALSQNIAQGWSNLFIETNLERRYEASDYARRFLENRLEEMRTKLEDSERKAVASRPARKSFLCRLARPRTAMPAATSARS